MYGLINSLDLQGGLDTSSPQFSPASQRSLAEGTWNSIISGAGFTRTWNGATSLGAGTGSAKMFQVGNTWGGIKNGGSGASGNFFQDVGKSRWGIGAGTPHIEGTNVSGFTLSTNLQLQIATAGVYGTPVQAGLSQPSAPEIGLVSTVGDVTGPVSCKIERSRPSTGARSVASPTSDVATGQASRIRVTFPAAITGQTHWRVYFTFQGFGGNGVHYLAAYTSSPFVTDIPESTVSAGTVDGVARSLEFNFKDGDLIPIEASFDDYAPPAATHAVRLQNVLCLAGCYADSTSGPSASSPGTAIAVSKENNYESYVPTSLLFLPEAVVDVLARPIDDYAYIACKNSIHALQFVGSRGEELPSCTLTTILPDIGIQYMHNWCQFRGRLLLYTAPGNLIMMEESGQFDTSFAAPVHKILKGFALSSTVLGYDPNNDSLVIFNGTRALIYSLTARQWRQIWLPDFSLTGTATSCTTSGSLLYFTLNSGGTLTAYEYDTDTSKPGSSFCSNYQRTGSFGSVHDIYEAALAVEGTAARTYLAINSNLMKTVFRRITTVNGNTTITDAESGFLATMVGKQIIIFGTGMGGGATNYKLTTIQSYTGSNQVVLASAPQASASEKIAFIGDFIGVSDSLPAYGAHAANFFPHLAELRSHQVAVFVTPTTDIGNVLGVDLLGREYPSTRAQA